MLVEAGDAFKVDDEISANLAARTTESSHGRGRGRADGRLYREHLSNGSLEVIAETRQVPSQDNVVSNRVLVLMHRHGSIAKRSRSVEERMEQSHRRLRQVLVYRKRCRHFIACNGGSVQINFVIWVIYERTTI